MNSVFKTISCTALCASGVKDISKNNPIPKVFIWKRGSLVNGERLNKKSTETSQLQPESQEEVSVKSSAINVSVLPDDQGNVFTQLHS